MNNILMLKKNFFRAPNTQRAAAAPKLSHKHPVSISHLKKLSSELNDLCRFWLEAPYKIDGALVSVHYNRVIPKSQRVSRILGLDSNSAYSSIRGAKYEMTALDGKDVPAHVITHFLPLEKLNHAAELLQQALTAAESFFPTGVITAEALDSFYQKKDLNHERFNALISARRTLHGRPLSISAFNQIIIDASNINRLAIDKFELPSSLHEAIITFYDTGKTAAARLSALGIDVDPKFLLSDTTALLTAEQIAKITQTAPYLISMAVDNLQSLDEFKYELLREQQRSIPAPQNEPVIGVIDKPFNPNSYFAQWVEPHLMVSPYEINENTAQHGTAVSSIIVDGPALNPDLDDGCGRFRVRHFGVLDGTHVNSFEIIQHIRRIVEENRDITVWNLSLGSPKEISPNFVSIEAFELDKLQNEYNVLFIIAGTNKPSRHKADQCRIGAPADSINALTVNAAASDLSAASYSRCGPVLYCFRKPDLAYYGGDKPAVKPHEKPLKVCVGSSIIADQCGTSFASPWIARKAAYLIHYLNMPREIVKALLIHKAADFTGSYDPYLGFGTVPKHIDDITHCKDDEIQVLISVDISEYSTYVYDLPIPQRNQKIYYAAHLTAAYITPVNRDQGIDYSDIELSIQFGRVKSIVGSGKAQISSIGNNKERGRLTEEEDRTLFAKWDNVKDFKDKISSSSRGKDPYSGNYGLQITAKHRKNQPRPLIKCGIVITFRELQGENRQAEFIKSCQARGWLVQEIDVNESIELRQDLAAVIEID